MLIVFNRPCAATEGFTISAGITVVVFVTNLMRFSQNVYNSKSFCGHTNLVESYYLSKFEVLKLIYNRNEV